MPTFNYGAGIRSNPMDAYNEMSGMVKQSRLAKLLGGYYQTGQADLGQIGELDPQAAQAIQKEQEQRGLAKLFGEAYAAPEDQRGGMLSQLIARGADPGQVMKLDPRFAGGGEQFTLSPGSARYGPDGKLIVGQPFAPANAKVIKVPDGNGGTVDMVFDPKARQLQPLPVPGQAPPNGANVQYDGPEEGRAAFMQAVQRDMEMGHPPGDYTIPEPMQGGRMGYTPPTPKSEGMTEIDRKINHARGLGATDEQIRNMVLGNAGAPQVKPPSIQEVKDASARRLKVPQIANLERGLQAIDAKLKGLDDNWIGTGPATGWGVGMTEEGQGLETAVGAIQNSLLALTRVPGIGSQSDLEARIANLQYPQTGNYAKNNKMLAANLRSLVEDIKAAYGSLQDADDEILSARRGARPQQQNKPAPANGGRKVVRTGTQNGRKVVQYSDGSVDYAD